MFHSPQRIVAVVLVELRYALDLYLFYVFKGSLLIVVGSQRQDFPNFKFSSKLDLKNLHFSVRP